METLEQLKEKKQLLNEMGVYYNRDTDTFKFDYDKNDPIDIIDLFEPQLYSSEFNKKVYHFGYRFNKGIRSEVKRKFTERLKNITLRTWSEKEDYKKFIIRPLEELDKKVGLSSFKCLIYPGSQRSSICYEIKDYIVDNIFDDSDPQITFELMKKESKNIHFDTRWYYEKNKKKLGFENDKQLWEEKKKEIEKMMKKSKISRL